MGPSTNIPGCKCPIEQIWNGSSCVTCPAGTNASNPGMTSNVQGCKCPLYWVNGTCTNVCPAGYSVSNGTCTICRQNSYSETPNSTSCTECPWVTGEGDPFQTETWGPGNTSINNCYYYTDKLTYITCPPGSSEKNTGAPTNMPGCKCPSGQLWSGSSCVPCPAGYFISNDICTKCRKNSYSGTINSTSCTECPWITDEGDPFQSETWEEGSTSIHDCYYYTDKLTYF